MHPLNHWPKPMLLIVMLLFASTVLAQPFIEVSQLSGISFSHNNQPKILREDTIVTGGGAVSDFNLDGYPDFYLLGGSFQKNRLYQNQGNGQFVNVADEVGVALENILGAGPTFADVDGDHDLDLLVFSVNKWAQPFGSDLDLLSNRPRLFINNNNLYTENLASGFDSGMPSHGGTFADLDQDGDLDLVMSHWRSQDTTSRQHFWENDGTGQFTDVTIDYLGLPVNANFDRWTFTPNITDYNEDGWLDVLMVSDFGTSRILTSNGINQNQLTFSAAQPPFITDENGMGSAVGDYDNDGDLDWFVTSIWDPDGVAEGNWGVSGNRLYRNLGGGQFEDATDEAGVRIGYWGWGACFADFNNDGHLDIFHENGFYLVTNLADEYLNDPARLFMSNGDGTFTEGAVLAGITHTGQGRGVSCVDYDLDGDLDIVIMPNNNTYQLYKNALNNDNHHLAVQLFMLGANTRAINAKIALTTATSTQLREVTPGNNFVSNNPLKQHFGLGTESQIQQLEITWPDGQSSVINQNILVDTTLSIGKHCHTEYLTINDLGTSDQVSLTTWLHEDDGSPLIGAATQLNIDAGPNLGYSASQNSAADGSVTYIINHQNIGTDRVRIDFEVNGTPTYCRALIRWEPVELIFMDNFESDD